MITTFDCLLRQATIDNPKYTVLFSNNKTHCTAFSFILRFGTLVKMQILSGVQCSSGNVNLDEMYVHVTYVKACICRSILNVFI